MRILVVFAHPVESSFHAALHRTIVAGLRNAGHEVDDCDLYAEGFDPVMRRAERASYHDTTRNRGLVASYVARLLSAEALVFCYPVWSYGPPAMMKGFFDRLFIPGVAFDLVDGRIVRKLRFRRLIVVTSYGQPRWLAWLNGDPPRRLIYGYVRRAVRPSDGVLYLAKYGINRATEASCARFIERVSRRVVRATTQ
jgi:putative NADPH-quinone reductase